MPGDEFGARIDAIFAASNMRSDVHLAVLKQSDDLISIILKGHLIVEELLTTGIEAYCTDFEQLDKAKLRFTQRVALLKALEKIPVAPPAFWDAVLQLNRLRNELAHNLDQVRIPKLSAAFVRSLERTSIQDIRFPRPLDGRDALIQALHYLIGGLEVLAIWQIGVEELIANKLQATVTK